MKKYTISILTYKALSYCKNCITALFQNTNMAEVNLILTANGSKEALEYFNELKAQHPDIVTVVWNEDNKGFIEPNKHALSLCETEFFILMNDDLCVYDKMWVQKLEEPFHLYEKAALSGPRGTCQSIGYDFNGYCGVAFEYLEGSLLCCKTEIVKKVGLFSDYLRFAYGEDSDLSLRLRANGYTLHKVENIDFGHVQGATSRHIPDIVKQNQAHNHVQLKKRWAHYLRVRKVEFPITVRRQAAHGDVLLATAILPALKKQWPLCPISIDTQPVMYPLFKNNPYVSAVGREIPRTEDTMFINLDMSYENRVGTHIVDAYADMAGITLDKRVTELYCPYSKEGERGWVAVHPGPTTWAGKNWPMDRWGVLCKKLQEVGYKILLVGHGNDMISCNRDLRGRTSIEELAAELAKCDLFIGVDSFPIHVAQAVKTPVIGLFGVTDPKYILTDGSKWLAAYDETHPEFGSRHKTPGRVVIQSDGGAMNRISVEQVLKLTEQFK